MQTLLHRLLTLLASGGILVSFSEFWFYEIGEEVGHLGILIAYGMLGFIFLATLDVFRVSDFHGFFIAACLLGFLIEGVPVPVVYSGPPFTILWTSMAWHALLSVTVGWLIFRRVMIHSTLANKLLFNATLGVSLGLWNSYSWNAVELDGTAEPVFQWDANDAFGYQFFVGYLLFIGGHALAPWIGRKSRPVSMTEYRVWVSLAILCSILVALSSGLIVLYVVFPVVLGICWWALERLSDAETRSDGDIPAILWSAGMTRRDYAITLFIPASAIGTYRLIGFAQIGIESNAILILTAGPISIWYFARALVASVRRTTVGHPAT